MLLYYQIEIYYYKVFQNVCKQTEAVLTVSSYKQEMFATHQCAKQLDLQDRDQGHISGSSIQRDSGILVDTRLRASCVSGAASVSCVLVIFINKRKLNKLSK